MLQAPEQRVNLNASGDDHVSFFARHLVPSPCGRFLLVSTDTGRLLVLRTGSWQHWPFPFFTLHTQQFHQFCAVWHRDSMYVYAGAAGGAVWVYHVGSGKVAAKLSVHQVGTGLLLLLVLVLVVVLLLPLLSGCCFCGCLRAWHVPYGLTCHGGLGAQLRG